MSTMSILTGSRNKSEVYSDFKSELGEIKEIVEEVGEASLSEDDHSDEKLLRQFDESLHYETDEEEKYDAKVGECFLLGPRLPHKEQLGRLLPLKKQLEKDQEDESLQRWKEQLLAGADERSLHFCHSCHCMNLSNLLTSTSSEPRCMLVHASEV